MKETVIIIFGTLIWSLSIGQTALEVMQKATEKISNIDAYKVEVEYVMSDAVNLSKRDVSTGQIWHVTDGYKMSNSDEVTICDKDFWVNIFNSSKEVYIKNAIDGPPVNFNPENLVSLVETFPISLKENTSGNWIIALDCSEMKGMMFSTIEIEIEKSSYDYKSVEVVYKPTHSNFNGDITLNSSPIYRINYTSITKIEDDISVLGMDQIFDFTTRTSKAILKNQYSGYKLINHYRNL